MPTVWNLLGMLVVAGLVAMCGTWALWAARGTRAYALAAVPLVVGTLAWWAEDGAWLGLYQQMSVVLWAPWSILAMGTAEGASLMLLGFALLATAALLASDGRRRLLLAATAGALAGSLFHLHAYVAIFGVMVIVAALVADRPAGAPLPPLGGGMRRRDAGAPHPDGHGRDRRRGDDEDRAAHVAGAALLIAKPGWLTRMWAPGLALAVPAVADRVPGVRAAAAGRR